MLIGHINMSTIVQTTLKISLIRIIFKILVNKMKDFKQQQWIKEEFSIPKAFNNKVTTEILIIFNRSITKSILIKGIMQIKDIKNINVIKEIKAIILCFSPTTLKIIPVASNKIIYFSKTLAQPHPRIYLTRITSIISNASKSMAPSWAALVNAIKTSTKITI